MSTVRVERCRDCGAMVGEGMLYDHQQKNHRPVTCVAGVHRWSKDATAEGDTCECGEWYRFHDHIELTW